VPQEDIARTLDALERKLRDLERELGAPGPAPPAGERPAPSTGGGLDELARQIDELGRFREQLRRIGSDLEEEYARVLARLEVEPPVPPPAPPPSPAAPDTVTVDAGPFPDLDSLAAFEEAVGALPGVEAVDVTGFEGRRALLDVRHGPGTALADELLALPVEVSRVAQEADRVVVELVA